MNMPACEKHKQSVSMIYKIRRNKLSESFSCLKQTRNITLRIDIDILGGGNGRKPRHSHY
jgi:hypothetical protein